MNALELIDRLCAVTTKLADIVRDQAQFIEQMEAVDEEIKKQFAEKREAADEELDLIELKLRP